ncbi:MAG TPA: MraY family glycosyltransferase, partial [Gaiellaceae bacterium]|nr:MraY family glycosyltransferase [Gaiellaceae bacterium]
MSFPDSVHALVRDTTAVWGFLTAACLVLLLTPLVVRLAPRIGGVDDRHDRPRVHGSRPIPRIGGLAIVIAIVVSMVIYIKPEGRYLGILLGTLMVATLGLIDDIRGINATVKMAGIVVAALIPVAGFGMTWTHVGLPLVGNFDLGWAAYPLTVFWIAALANLVNLIDGMDSLASGIVAIAAGSFAILAA